MAQVVCTKSGMTDPDCEKEEILISLPYPHPRNRASCISAKLSHCFLDHKDIQHLVITREVIV
jgi:hypothetical protein